MDHLSDLPELRLLLVHGPAPVLPWVGRRGLGHEHDDGGAEALSLSLREEVLGRLRQDRMVRVHHVLDAVRKGRKLLLHQRERVLRAARRKLAPVLPGVEDGSAGPSRHTLDELEVLGKAGEGAAGALGVEGILQQTDGVRVLPVQELLLVGQRAHPGSSSSCRPAEPQAASQPAADRRGSGEGAVEVRGSESQSVNDQREDQRQAKQCRLHDDQQKNLQV
eukprot:768574-Hanusia_phi.AAC.4